VKSRIEPDGAFADPPTEQKCQIGVCRAFHPNKIDACLESAHAHVRQWDGAQSSKAVTKHSCDKVRASLRALRDAP
jgi:hypothetical protein